MPIDKKNIQYAVIAGIVAMFITVGIYAYLGSFSRHLADDYCETVRVTEVSITDAVIERYSLGAWRSANRYSNIFLIGVSVMFGENNMQVMIILMILLWCTGIIWSVVEARRLFNMNWMLHFDIFLGVAFVFFSLWQAPNVFQTLYWRSSIVTHFAPLVLGSLLLAFLLRQLRQSQKKLPSLMIRLFVFFVAFVFAGFSEPPTATALTVSILLIATIKFLGKSPASNYSFNLLVWVFTGVLFGIIVMAFSPAGVDVVKEKGLMPIQILSNSFFYSYLFIVDSLKTQPLPTLISALIPFVLIWLYQQTNPSELSSNQKRTVWFIVIAIPVLTWLLIAASFSPSVYGQSFPIERARFLARVLMITALMLEGGLFGLLTQRIQFKPNPAIGQWIGLSVLTFISVVYPLRTAYYIAIYDLPEYRDRARLWDLRDAFIKRHAAQGETDLVVPGFSGIYGIKEIDDNPNHWINSCAAEFYGVTSIRAIGVDNLEEILNE